MLVQYDRPDISGPKLSEFDVLDIAEPEKLDRMLTNSLGVLGEVKRIDSYFCMNRVESIWTKSKIWEHFWNLKCVYSRSKRLKKGQQLRTI